VTISVRCSEISVLATLPTSDPSASVRPTQADGYRGILAIQTDAGTTRYANFGLSFDQDEQLTDWMTGHLRLAVWPKEGQLALDLVETRPSAFKGGRRFFDPCDRPRRLLLTSGGTGS
jgi:antibiotic biosynthesis monooxygenase (ABM) superfamily enzyme